MTYSITSGALSTAESLIRQFEGYRANPYRDVHGLWTIGFGNRALWDGKPVTAATEPLDELHALYLLSFTLKERVIPSFSTLVPATLTDNQAGALLSLTWNIGNTAFAHSDVLRDLDAGKLDQVPSDMLHFSYSRGRYIEGLRLRREHEGAVFAGRDRPSVVAPTTPDVADALNAAELAKVSAPPPAG